jgi:hypothetical protein
MGVSHSIPGWPTGAVTIDITASPPEINAVATDISMTHRGGSWFRYLIKSHLLSFSRKVSSPDLVRITLW